MYGYDEIIPFVLWQLEHYGLDCTRKQVGEMVGVSSSTVKKYDSQSIIYTPKGMKRVIAPGLMEKLKNFPFPNRQVKTTYEDQLDFIWIAGESGLYKKKKEINPPAPLDDLTIYNPKLKYGLITRYSNKSGLYMLAQVLCMPHRLNERYYLIKIGMSETNLNNRINSYKGSNPLAICIDTIEVSKDKVKTSEKEWHIKMGNLYNRLNGSEWFSVPYEDYLRFLEFGFDVKI